MIIVNIIVIIIFVFCILKFATVAVLVHSPQLSQIAWMGGWLT